jgi:hypothetical protein
VVFGDHDLPQIAAIAPKWRDIWRDRYSYDFRTHASRHSGVILGAIDVIALLLYKPLLGLNLSSSTDQALQSAAGGGELSA